MALVKVLPVSEILIYVGFAAAALSFVSLLMVGEAMVTNKRWRAAAAELGADFKPERFRSKPELTVKHLGVDVKVTTRQIGHRETSQFFIRYELRSRPTHPAFKLTSRGAASWVGKKLGRGKDVGFGAEGFDELVSVQASDQEAVRQYLSPERQDNVLSLVRAHKNVVLTQETLVAEVKDNRDAARTIAWKVHWLVDSALEIWDLDGAE